MKKEYYRSVRKVFKTKLKSGNVFKAINTWALSVMRHSAASLGWSRLHLEEIDWRTKKLLTMRNEFHQISNVDQLYLLKVEVSRGLTGVQNTMETMIWGLINFKI